MCFDSRFVITALQLHMGVEMIELLFYCNWGAKVSKSFSEMVLIFMNYLFVLKLVLNLCFTK